MRKITFFLTCMVLFLIPEIQAQFKNEIHLSDIEVNANRQKQFSEIGKVITVLDKEQISKLPAQSIDALLKFIPGLDIRQRGTGATQADISMKGSSFDQVLVLLNGVNITDPQTGHYNLDVPLDMSEIDRIEVLQGASARRYGSQAFAGVINIVTELKSKSFLNGAVSWGSFDTRNSRFSFKLGKKRLQHFTSFANQQSDGYRANTDYKTYNLFSQTSWKTRHTGQFDLQFAYQNKSFGANGFYALSYPNQFEHTSTRFSSLSWEKNFRFMDVKLLSYERSHYDRFELFRNFEGAASWYSDHNYHLTDVSGGSGTVQFYLPVGKISGGIELKNDHIFSTVLGDVIENVNDRPRNYYENDKYFNREANRFLQTLFAGYSGSWKNWLFSAGLSTTNSREYGLITNYGIDASYYFDNDLSVFGSWNTASRLPTFTDLYYKSATQTANPDLKPEFSKTLETGVKYSRNRFNVSGSLFFRQGTDIIDWVKYPDQTKWVSQNITGLNTFGAEVTAAYDFKNSALRNIGFSWNYLISDKNQAAYDSKYALDYLRNQMKFQLTHAIIKRIDMTWNLAYNDRAGTYADFSTGNQTNYQPYLTMGTRVGWKLGKWLIYADVNNLFNQECVDFGGLPLPGINGMMGIQWKLW